PEGKATLAPGPIVKIPPVAPLPSIVSDPASTTTAPPLWMPPLPTARFATVRLVLAATLSAGRLPWPSRIVLVGPSGVDHPHGPPRSPPRNAIGAATETTAGPLETW